MFACTINKFGVMEEMLWILGWSLTWNLFLVPQNADVEDSNLHWGIVYNVFVSRFIHIGFGKRTWSYKKENILSNKTMNHICYNKKNVIVQFLQSYLPLWCQGHLSSSLYPDRTHSPCLLALCTVLDPRQWAFPHHQ